jgi:RimJ/RimL family protein N-acetyltransferase
MKQESWDDFWRWGVWTHKPKAETTLADDEVWCTMLHERVTRREKLHFLAFQRTNSQLIGAGSLLPDKTVPDKVCLGYLVRSTAAGQGYGTEIATALCRYGLEQLHIAELGSFHADGNIGSLRVLEKTGFERVAVLPLHHQIHTTGQTVDEIHYRLPGRASLSDISVSW